MAAAPELFELSNGSISMKITNFGATITSLLVPDKSGVCVCVCVCEKSSIETSQSCIVISVDHLIVHPPHTVTDDDKVVDMLSVTGNLADVVLGFDTTEPYIKGQSRYFGCIVGRVANRIRDGKFTLDGSEYSLAINNPPNSLHGGKKGYDKVIWDVVEYQKDGTPSISFKYHSQDGEEGYPGDVTVSAKYSLPSSNCLRLEMEAIPSSKPTPISLAQHTYWNLAGHNSGNILDHFAQIWAQEITPINENMIPTGEMMPVKGTPFDFNSEERIGSRIDQVPGGYDHNYVLGGGEKKMGLKHAARVRDPSSARVLDLWTDAPGMQFYTGNFVNGIVGKGGTVYGKHAGLCMETQGFPNAINQPNFPSIVVKPGEKYKHTMLFEFSVHP